MSDSTTEPRELVRRLWHEIWFGDLTPLAGLLTDPYVRHTRDGSETMAPETYVRHIESMVREIRGTELTFDHISSVDDMVYARLTLHGVRLSLGEPVKITWLAHYRIADGQIAEAWTMHQADVDW